MWFFLFNFPFGNHAMRHSVILGHLVCGQVSVGRLQGGARAPRLHPLVGIISVEVSLSYT